jgi:hypothetical protein
MQGFETGKGFNLALRVFMFSERRKTYVRVFYHIFVQLFSWVDFCVVAVEMADWAWSTYVAQTCIDGAL